MTPLNQMSVGELISSLRDIVLILSMLSIGWKLRSWVQPAVDFIKRADRFFSLGEAHIQRVEYSIDRILNNHLDHIQSDLGHISGREPRKEDKHEV